MDPAMEERAWRALRAVLGAGAMAMLIALAALAGSIGAPKAVEPAQPVVEAPTTPDSDAPIEYFPGRFADPEAEIEAPIESF